MPTPTPPSLADQPALRCDAQANLERILASARVVFAEQGLEAKLADVAKHAGVGVGTVYRRFASKDELIQALFLSRVNDIVVIADSALANDDPWAGLVYFLKQSGQKLADDQGLRELLISGHVESPAFAEARARMSERMTVLVSRAKEQGKLRQDFEPTDVPAIMWTIQASRDFAGSRCPDLWRRQLGFLIDGLRQSRECVSELAAPAITRDQIASVMSMRHHTPDATSVSGQRPRS
ncbi:TetR/AcrR family transcriptional regulator [Antrihabitans cavernicola]|uniref:TetR/AcrR family transcriptional regulator n=1 Tax=Antrihabitans cavernicola TaxID=2495913 RepID=A0A5A7SF63_9NOCA|nr:TetR/AcrR family transcriptional regulator [Spelaeibacter cavernicola]KAA0023283.1 TetR/AcrR family transcriptional regulator [Spelaeibacter cavernicola]